MSTKCFPRRTNEKLMLRFMLTALLALASDLALAQRPSVIFTPSSGFSGTSEGDGVLRMLFRRRTFHVESHGFERQDGSFELDQAVQFAGKASKNRTWIIHSMGDARYSGTLTGSAGVVTGETSGAQLMLRYRVKGPVVIHQTLTLSADGKSIENNGRIAFLGIPIGSIHESIVRKK